MAVTPEKAELIIGDLQRELAWARLKIQSLEEQLRLERIKWLGKKSETLSDLQLQLLSEEEPGVCSEEVEAEALREPVKEVPPRQRRHPGRRPLPAHLPRVEAVVACADPKCRTCGADTDLIGYDQSEVLDAEPRRYFVKVTKREKRVCKQCASSACRIAPVVMAELAPRIVEKGLASDAIVVDTVIAKYCDHLPLYRQAVILEREAGLEIGRATLDGWVMRVGELLEPVSQAMRAELLAGGYLQADETTVPVQVPDKSGSNHQGYLWQYSKPGGGTVFDFRMGREREGPEQFLGKWEGILQTDGYQAYDNIGGPKLVHVGCWAHARRYFVDAVKVNEKDGEAIKMVTRMDALFVVDREARNQHLSSEQRLALRREHAESWAQEIHEACLVLKNFALPKSALGQAVQYTLNQWPRLRRCFDYAEVELSNNLAENSMRPIALGRKNWLHVGSKEAGPRVAAILSVIESCRRLGVAAREYLIDVLPGLDRKKTSQIANLTPEQWLARR
jgi:transposase